MAGPSISSEQILPAPAELAVRDTPALSEREALERVKKGNKQAYQVIVTRYMKKAYFIALGFVHNHQDALDISQDSFVKAYRSLKVFDTRRPFFPWFYEIMKNRCLDHLKRQKLKNEVPLDSVRVLRTEDEDRELKATMWKGISALPFDLKEIIILRYFQQLSYREIAAVTGKPVGTVMSSLFTARTRLKKILGKYLGLEEEGPKRGVHDES
jgi:RNA polymerase sigma-70 factor (ECF subfamily)